MTGALSFHPAVAADFERLVALRIRVMRAHLERVGRFDPERARARFRGGFAPEHLRLVHVDGIFAGCVSLKPEGDGLALEHFYLDADVQGRGVGAAVLAVLLAEADAAGLPVRLGVLKGSPAARLYERHGFAVTHEDQWDVYYERPGRRA
jgi:GNAT superfamily N-acetyltransferase